ncbi:hypothetical protein ACFLZG_04005 [Thermodesulfobacteriota bacterium]
MKVENAGFPDYKAKLSFIKNFQDRKELMKNMQSNSEVSIGEYVARAGFQVTFKPLSLA